eukprot:CAMPEP_0185168922 /NCGR_PEP_ID=MMETSP1139-20130426/16564_1 /TAXON_ID=298111 /ORGANISM="Pavlova sp., Strain CCMP459" /LENGTH=167 /DNA_ID=CAMNT_0027734443 /DNA_START=978 /DNA_END=1481 /DNA_ORIENTATION=+
MSVSIGLEVALDEDGLWIRHAGAQPKRPAHVHADGRVRRDGHGRLSHRAMVREALVEPRRPQVTALHLSPCNVPRRVSDGVSQERFGDHAVHHAREHLVAFVREVEPSGARGARAHGESRALGGIVTEQGEWQADARPLQLGGDQEGAKLAEEVDRVSEFVTIVHGA